VPAYVRDRVLTDDRGELTGLIGVSIDISSRVAVEKELRTTRNYLTTVTDSVAEGLYTLDADGRVTYLNKAAERLLGWRREQLIGRIMHDITHFRRPDGSAFPIEACPIVQARRGGTVVRVEEDLFIRADGRELAVAYTAAPFLTPEGTEGCVVVFEDISERQARQRELERDAEKLAWIRRVQTSLVEGRFELYGQPIVELAGGAVVQHELLLRMHNDDGSVETPGAFLPIAEEYGLIGDIDRWVVGRATELAARGLPVELNVSGRSIGDPLLLKHIERRLAVSGADPRLLVFEITETALVDDEESALRFAEHLHALGCKLALDDFGTGYGGFTYLKRLPVDLLKIDREFVRDLTGNPASRHVVEAVVALARGFGLQTVAEGVEDRATLDLLRALGVDMAQGYFIARPRPIEEDPSGDR
jgi:PAS domain S-box-containing protein